MSNVTFDYSKASGFVQEHEIEYMSELAEQAKDRLLARTGAGNDFLGWIDLPVDYDKEEFDRILKAAEKIKSDSDVLVVIGIGGSYLGARAAIEFLGHSFANEVSRDLFCRKQHQQHIPERPDRCDRRQGFLCECNFKIRNNHRTGHRLPCI